MDAAHSSREDMPRRRRHGRFGAREDTCPAVGVGGFFPAKILIPIGCADGPDLRRVKPGAKRGILVHGLGLKIRAFFIHVLLRPSWEPRPAALPRDVPRRG